MSCYFCSTTFAQGGLKQYLTSLKPLTTLFRDLIKGLEDLATEQDKSNFETFTAQYNDILDNLIIEKTDLIASLENNDITINQLKPKLSTVSTNVEMLNSILKRNVSLIRKLGVKDVGNLVIGLGKANNSKSRIIWNLNHSPNPVVRSNAINILKRSVAILKLSKKDAVEFSALLEQKKVN